VDYFTEYGVHRFKACHRFLFSRLKILSPGKIVGRKPSDSRRQNLRGPLGFAVAALTRTLAR
jgi:hypothetical protein